MSRPCPVCGLSRYQRERSPHGKTRCLECGFFAQHSVWDKERKPKKESTEPALLYTNEEVRAFLLGIRAAFMLTSSSKSLNISYYGKGMLDKTDTEYKDRYDQFVALLAEYGVVCCGVDEPAKL
jgi:hypothetical protein